MRGSQEPRIKVEPSRISTDGEDAALLMAEYGSSSLLIVGSEKMRAGNIASHRRGFQFRDKTEKTYVWKQGNFMAL